MTCCLPLRRERPENGVALTSSSQVPATTKNMSSDIVEAVVCKVEDMKNGEMKEVDMAGQGSALLIKEGSEFYAIGAKCSHYGAPLSKGVLCAGRVRCPWHGACFNVKTGDIEEFPGLDGVPSFQVEVADGTVKVKADKKALANVRKQKNMCKKSNGKQNVLIIGGGPASVACSETLRQEGFDGDITIVTQEKYLPYDRIKLSKAMDSKPDAIALRPADFYSSYDINVKTEKQVTSVDTSGKSVKFADGSSAQYDSLVIATGGKPRVLPIPGVDLQNVFSLRTPDDANSIAAISSNKNVVIIGSSFIGMEVAAYLADKVNSVSVVDIIKVPFQLVLGEKVGAVMQKILMVLTRTYIRYTNLVLTTKRLEVASYMSEKAASVHVLARGSVPLQNVFGNVIGKVFKQMHEENGVKFHFEAGIKEFVGEAGKVTHAVLSNGTKLPADICILGVGVVPATDFLKDSGIQMTNRGFLPVDEYMATDKPGVFAAGDIVEFPLFSAGGSNVNIQHWQMAHSHGRTAAYSILGKKKAIKSVPYFWTVMYKRSVRYTGYGPGYDDVIVHGEPEAYKFAAFYTKGDVVVAVASLNFDPIVSQAAEMMQAGKTILKKDIVSDPTSWVGKL